MNSQYIEELWESIDPIDIIKILRKMEAGGIKQPGFAKLEKVPSKIMLNTIIKVPVVEKSFLNCAKNYFLGNYENLDNIEITETNILGFIAKDILENNGININEYKNKIKPNTDEQILLDQDYRGDNKMKRYLGDMCVEQIFIDRQYYNFYPRFEIIDGKLIPIGNAKELFPEYGNFFLESKNIDLDDYIFNNDLCILDIDEDDLQDNIKSNGTFAGSHKKINFESLRKRKKVHSLSEMNIYPIVTAEKDKIDFIADSIININEEFQGFKYMNLAILYYNNEYYGPFEIGYRKQDKKNYIKNNIKENRYILDKININDDNYDPIVYCKLGRREEKEHDLFVAMNSCIEIEHIDKINDTVLLKEFEEAMNLRIDDDAVTFDKLNELVDVYRTSLLTESSQYPNLVRGRVEKIKDILEDASKIKKYSNSVISLIKKIFENSENNEDIIEIVERLTQDPDFINRIQKVKIISDKIQSKEDELEKLNQNIDLKNKELEEKILKNKEIEEKSNQEVAKEFIQKHKDEIDNLAIQKETLQNDINELQDKKDSVAKRLNQLNNIESLDQQINEKAVVLKYHEKSIEQLEEGLNKILDSKGSKMVDLAFDGMLSSKMLQKAAEWEQDNNEKQFLDDVNKVNNLSVSSLQGEDLIEYLVERIHEYRPTYDRNMIINMLICISQGFLTVFSGEPGTGKTSICKILSRVLGLMLPADLLPENNCSFNPNRFSTVAVERGWTSKRDFIGYYNPLTKRFDNNNRQLYDSFKVLDLEARNNQNILPYMILLDEANLSPMEYYWADFMSLCDDFDENASLNLGDNNCYKISPSLRFLATINNDHTTEALSPRLIDRAWVIELPKVKGNLSFKKYTNNGVELITWNSIINTFDNLDEQISMTGTVKETYDLIVKKLKDIGISVSPRVDIAIQRYWSVAQSLFENDIIYGTDSSIVALDYAVSQRLLPHIDGNGKAFYESLDEILNICKTQNLKQSAGILKRIIDEGERTMNYYQFFA